MKNKTGKIYLILMIVAVTCISVNAQKGGCTVNTTPQAYTNDQNREHEIERLAKQYLGTSKDDVGRWFAETTRGVTSFKEIRNDTPCLVKVYKMDKKPFQADTQTVEIAPNSVYRGDFWIPWADNADQYREHYMTISVDGREIAWLWQQTKEVRVNFTAGFSDGARLAPGVSQGGGDRTLIIEDMDNRPTFVIAGMQRR